MRVLWYDQAESDLDRIFEDLAARDPLVALRISESIRQRVALLAGQPGIGRIGRVKETRELVIPRTPYIVAYAIDHQLDVVIVLRVLHGAQLWTKDFGQD